MGGTFQFNGIVSGLNTQAIIQAMLQPYQQPINDLQAQETTIQNNDGEINNLSTKMSTLQNAVQALQLQANVVAMKVTPTDSTIVTGTANPDAVSQTFNLTVNHLATDTNVQSSTAIGQPITLNTPLASAGFALAPTTGTFSINGVSITIDSSTVLSDGTDAAGADTIISKINNSGAGVTASIVNDSQGRPNLIQLSSNTASSIQIGSAGDTSNFLTAANLITAGGGTTAISTGYLGQTNNNATLNNARLSTALASSGSFTINGVSISYDATTDTLNDVINRINTANAGVTASYDPIADKVMLQSSTTGSLAISLQDNSGNFLAATGLLNATQSYGQNASYSISNVNNGQPLSSTSNTISNVVPGVTLNLQGPGTTSVTVGTDPTPLTNAMQTFVTAFNAVLDEVNTDTSYNSSTKQEGIFFTDSSIFGINGDMLGDLFTPGPGMTGAIQSMADLGLSTGAIGSSPGTTNDLTLDTSKLSSALQSNPNAVAQLLQGQPGTNTGVMGALYNYLNGWIGPTGTFASRLSSDQGQISDIQQQIADAQQTLNDQQTALTQQFANMEATLAQLQQQGAALSSQFSALNSSAASSAAASSASSAPSTNTSNPTPADSPSSSG